MAPPPAADLRPVPPRIWRACAGPNVPVPALHSRVYYFPQGHIERYCLSSPPSLSYLALSRPMVLCVVSDVNFFADPVTDEAFIWLKLVPSLEHPGAPAQFLQQNAGNVDEDEDKDRINSFAKVLTTSDANNGGGFSVPRYCADSIFPPLNYQADPPVQTLSVTDVHGAVWEFRHIFRGTPRRHLLTTGWSKFVNHKKLIAGDSVVFMRAPSGGMFIGVRRAARHGNGGEYSRWREANDGIASGGRGRLTPAAVADAAEKAAKGLPFEVVYYPKAGWVDFVVRAETVEASFRRMWTVGTRVKITVENDESSRPISSQGTVTSVAVLDSRPWGPSPWRMLEVAWDEPDGLQNSKRVSPWQLEYLAPPYLETTIQPMKKQKFLPSSGLIDGEGQIFMTSFNNSAMGQMHSSLLNYNSFPAGMQGARQDQFSLLTNLLNGNPTMCTDYLTGNSVVPKLKRVSTDLNIGSLQSGNLSPDSQSSVPSFGTELAENRCHSTKVGISSFQLFGKVIHFKEPSGSGIDDGVSMEDDGNETEGVGNSLDLSLTYPYRELLDRLDVPCERASAVEAFSS